MGRCAVIFFRDDEESFMLSRYVPEVIERAVGRYLESSPIRRRIGKSVDVSGDTGPA